MALPSLRALRRDNPEAEITCFIHRKLEALMHYASVADRVLVHDEVRNWRQWVQWVKGARTYRADVAVLFTNSFKSALLTKLGGANYLMGLDREGRGLLLDHAVKIDEDLKNSHRSLWYEKICQPLLDGPIDMRSSSVVSEKDQQEFRFKGSLRSPCVAMAVGAAYGPAKEYGTQNFLDVVALFKEKGFQVVVVGTQKEFEAGEKIRESFPHVTVNLAGKTSLGELVTLLSLTDGYVGNDSGPMHVSALLGKPTIGIYGPTDPTWVGPVGDRARSVYEKQECSPCYKRICPLKGNQHMACMQSIQPARIVDEFMKLYEGSFEPT